MDQYAVVENGQITETYSDLPHCWRHISGLDLSKDDDEYLNSQGWYKITPVTIEHNTETHIISRYDYVYSDNKVVAIPLIIVREQPADNVPTHEERISSIRQMRDQELSKCDWTQAVDVIESHSTEWNIAWKQYRQKLRDLPDLYNEIGDYFKFVEHWPSTPTIIN